MKLSVLEATTKPRNRTRIHYLATLNYVLTEEILEKLMADGLVNEVKAKRGADKRYSAEYVISEKGLEILRKWNEIKKKLCGGNDGGNVF